MRLTVLIENTTLIDRYFRSEPGISFYIEDGDSKILFDCGYSDLFIDNAFAMGIDLLNVGFVVLSHGHIDHTGGLPSLVAHHIRAGIEGKPASRPVFITHPATFGRKKAKEGGDAGCPVSAEYLSMFGDVKTSVSPQKVSERITFLGEIPRKNPKQTAQSSAFVLSKDGWVPDPVIEDSCLVYHGDNGLVIICGCTHAGIEHTVAYARSVCGDDRVTAVIGGLHLYSANPARIEEVSLWYAGSGIQSIYPCHCTGLAATIALSRYHPITQIGVGSHLAWDE
ncbi:MBL fold metallo-hydrolase [Methanocalculus taiwanensis]|uniref:MBL fold metallo-hydrolase n=1 Tax=Methanocalculus taiwanensis TaxID=106207 RepID=A0ABD4TGL8_9EURY|nr:MBL fold metallo-hydrolase [Methanocalculus taiwanensis]MCQ1537437.1 MBL fold metallo-hydrolase [Methanocalculus taiwanensis]